MIVLTMACTKNNVNQTNEYKRALLEGVQVESFAQHGVEIPEDLKGRNVGYFEQSSFEQDCNKLIADLKAEEMVRQRVKKEQEYHSVLVEKKEQEYRSNVLEKLITLTRKKTEGLPLEKVKESRKMIVDNYLKRTIIRRIATIGCTFEEDLEGQYIWLHDDVEQFKREEVDYRIICSQIAEEITAGEHRYLTKLIVDNTTSMNTLSASDISRPDFSVLEREIAALFSRGHNPNVMLAPIEEMSTFIEFYYDKINWQFGDREQLVLEGRPPITIFWSNVKVPMKEFIILDTKALRWSVRPDEEDGALATAVGVSPLYRDKIAFFAYTLYKVEMLAPEAISITTIVD